MPKKKIIRPGSPYSHGVRVGDTLYVSGQVPIRGQDVSDNIKDQTTTCLENLESVLQESGFTIKDIVKVTIYLVDEKDIPSYREAYVSFFNGRNIQALPAASAIVVSSLFNEKWMIEIDAIAAKG
ncbi:MAG: RidA family protein [Candidatus Thorarchaeota archaeon]|jgi:2-iminobutanoate/2-iminopropanoate deaminase